MRGGAVMGSQRIKKLKPPLSESQLRKFKAGDLVSITGRIVTARDRAYARAIGLLRAGKKLPLDLQGEVIYHCGPLVARTRKGLRILSAGPTTSARLDHLQVEFVERTGVRALVGKGGVSEEVAAELGRLGCIYLAFTGGAGVLAAQKIERIERVMWRDLGDAEALWLLRVRDFGPLIVAIDASGKSLYKLGQTRVFPSLLL
jgi:fumarate hydratase subunit beta